MESGWWRVWFSGKRLVSFLAFKFEPIKIPHSEIPLSTFSTDLLRTCIIVSFIRQDELSCKLLGKVISFFCRTNSRVPAFIAGHNPANFTGEQTF